MAKSNVWRAVWQTTVSGLILFCKEKKHTFNSQLLIFNWLSLVFACVHNFFVWQPPHNLACFITLSHIKQLTPSRTAQYSYTIFNKFLIIPIKRWRCQFSCCTYGMWFHSHLCAEKVLRNSYIVKMWLIKANISLSHYLSYKLTYLFCFYSSFSLMTMWKLTGALTALAFEMEDWLL